MFLEGNRSVKSKNAWMMYTVALLLRRWPSQNYLIGHTWRRIKQLLRLIMPNYRKRRQMAGNLSHLAKKKCSFTMTIHRLKPCWLHGQKFVELGFKLLTHSMYSPVLAPCDLLLLLNLKRSLAGQIFDSNEEFIANTEAYFTDLQTTYFPFKEAEHCWVKFNGLTG